MPTLSSHLLQNPGDVVSGSGLAKPTQVTGSPLGCSTPHLLVHLLGQNQPKPKDGAGLLQTSIITTGRALLSPFYVSQLCLSSHRCCLPEIALLASS